MKSFVAVLALLSSVSVATPVAQSNPQPLCGGIGYDRERPQAFYLDKSGQKASFAPCKTLCTQKKGCQSFAIGKGTCLLYKAPTKNNFEASRNSPYKFYDLVCPAPTSSSPASTRSSTISSRSSSIRTSASSTRSATPTPSRSSSTILRTSSVSRSSSITASPSSTSAIVPSSTTVPSSSTSLVGSTTAITSPVSSPSSTSDDLTTTSSPSTSSSSRPPPPVVTCGLQANTIRYGAYSNDFVSGPDPSKACADSCIADPNCQSYSTEPFGPNTFCHLYDVPASQLSPVASSTGLYRVYDRWCAAPSSSSSAVSSTPSASQTTTYITVATPTDTQPSATSSPLTCGRYTTITESSNYWQVTLTSEPMTQQKCAQLCVNNRSDLICTSYVILENTCALYDRRASLLLEGQPKRITGVEWWRVYDKDCPIESTTPTSSATTPPRPVVTDEE